MIKLIRAIAGKTNLLALNATIEAARAGESGRGFAVVASEVKALALQTAKATEEIASHIQAVQDSTSGAVEAIRQITARMQEINAATAAVTASVMQQNSATEEISHNVASAALGTGHVVAVLGQVAGAATANQRFGGRRARRLAGRRNGGRRPAHRSGRLPHQGGRIALAPFGAATGIVLVLRPLEDFHFNSRSHGNEKHQRKGDGEADNAGPHGNHGPLRAAATHIVDALEQREREQYPEIGRQADGAELRHQHDHAGERNTDDKGEDKKDAVDAHARQAVLAAALPSAACAAASRAIGTRNGEQDT